MSEEFLGHYRKQAKTSIVRTSAGEIAPSQKFSSLDAFMRSLPKDGSPTTDAFMRKKYPKLTVTPGDEAAAKAAPGARVPEERRNVEVVCWLCDAKKEGDDDFHIIIGNAAKPTKFLNAEVSGLPPVGSPDRAQLIATRVEVQKLIGTIPSGGYLHKNPPMKVKIAGSILFDGDHSPGTIGPLTPVKHRPDTVWEIHPILSVLKA